MSLPPRRPIKRLLVSNRGEIATRILSTARELDIETYAIYTSGDASHARSAAHAIELSSPSSYMNIDELVDVVRKHGIDSVHPGYGFLSESAEFARRMWEEAGAVVIGPGWGILEQTGDKLRARSLAVQCNVPVLPALESPTNNPADILAFASRTSLPIMIKAIDGGGGRGIRLIRKKEELVSAAKRAIEESPSRQVFAEKAAIDGFRHIEVQIVGDGRGGVRHLFERECSIQRRYQKVVEMAPSTIEDRGLVGEVIDAAVRMAQKVNYYSLGTFEFLVHPHTKTHYFLEINPRLQVEHTVTECIHNLDLVATQLLLAQNYPLTTALPLPDPHTQRLPTQHSLQLRLCAENPRHNHTLSTGLLRALHLPSGNGIRTDTHLHLTRGPEKITPDFDSLLAKLIITAPTREACVAKAAVALQDTAVEGVMTNLGVLRGIVADGAFRAGTCDTTWFETNHAVLLEEGERIGARVREREGRIGGGEDAGAGGMVAGSAPSSGVLFRKGDAWDVTLEPLGGGDGDGDGDGGSTTTPSTTNNNNNNNNNNKPPSPSPLKHNLLLTRLLRTTFPTSLSAEILYTTPSTCTPYTLHLTSSPSHSPSPTHTPADPTNPNHILTPFPGTHILTPFPGTLIELCVDVGDEVAAGDTVAVVRQMKMELEVRSQRAGRVGWVTEEEEGRVLGEGSLVCVLEGDDGEGGGGGKGGGGREGKAKL